SRRKPMICSSEKRFFTSNLLGIGNWTLNRCATQTRGDVAAARRAVKVSDNHGSNPVTFTPRAPAWKPSTQIAGEVRHEGAPLFAEL
ncbi:hypothetical protein XavaCFBP5823_01585, partial [Xanthomonas axonopodis pv. vasculorum]